MEVRQTLTASLSLSLPLFSSCAHREFKSPPILEGKDEEEEEIVSTVTAAATSERAASRRLPRFIHAAEGGELCNPTFLLRV